MEIRSRAYPTKCIDLNASNGVDVILWECHGGQNQKWSMDANGLIRSKVDMNKCITVQGLNDSTKIVLQTCENNDGYHKWEHNLNGALALIGHSNKVIDVANSDQQTLWIWEWNTLLDKRWDMFCTS